VYICNTITFENLDLESSFLVRGYVLREYGSRFYMKVIGSRSGSQEQKSEISYSRNVKFWPAVSPVQ